MLIVEPRIRSSLLKMGLIIFIACISLLPCIFVPRSNSEIFFQVFDYGDLTSMSLLCFAIASVVLLTIIFQLLMLFGFEYIPSGQSSCILPQLRNHLADNACLCFAIYLYIAGCIGFVLFYLLTELKLHWEYFLVAFCASILFACFLLVIDYENFELSSSQKMKKSIGYSWAYGAYKVFYEKILIDITKRMSDFEEKNGITLLVKKLVIICPLSCNANGTLEGKDGAMEVFGALKEIILDEGGANNRNYKTNVYKIRGPLEAYIAAEIPSPLATLYESRDTMDSVIREYHRVCFIETLKELTKSENCIILEYDDLDSKEDLHNFLLSKLEDRKFVSVVK